MTNLSKLKKRPSYPFDTIATAIAFSPRLESVLAETKRLVSLFNSALILIHIGEKTKEKEEELEKLLEATKINKDTCRVIWMEGDTVDTVLKLCKLNIVDLLILGAVEKENLFKYYVGSVARKLSRRAKCSVLLLTHPSLHPKKIKKIVVNGVDHAKTIHTLNTSLYIAKKENLRDITVVQEINMPTLTMAIAESSTAPEASKIKKEMVQEENSKLNLVISKLHKEDVEVNVKTINGKPGYAVANYTKNKNADLLVFNSPDTYLGIFDRIFTHDIEYVLADLPSNLLIVHSRV